MSASAAPIKHEGFLTKEGGGFKSWKKRWFILKGGDLSYYKTKGELVPLGVIHLNTSGHIKNSDRKKRVNGFEVQTPSRTYFLCSETEEERFTYVAELSFEMKFNNISPTKQPQQFVGFTTSNNDNINQQLNQVLILLQTLQSQSKKIASFQNQTYEWNLKHHQNLKNVLKSFNRLNSIIDCKGTKNELNDQSNNENNNELGELSFHQKIINAYNPLDPFSEELQHLIMQIDKSLFIQLRDDSIEIVYPFILKWLKENSSLAIIVLSLVIIWECSIKFNHLFGIKKFKDINKKILQCLDDFENKGIITTLINQGVFPFSEDEFNNLKFFLNS
ncbi:hypothetical protein RB653_007396 [Dictyostelium firmibasis]|uniref:PH domain-containing protein n=1 Tax=Dictyostelium firmibasis TaxID=79012 RepID=A0AAN7U151_9MYCE